MRAEFIEIDIPGLSKKCFQGTGRRRIGVPQCLLVSDELFNSGSKFHWRPPNPKLETSRRDLSCSFAQSAVIGCVCVRKYSVKVDSRTSATCPSFVRSTFA